MKRAQRTDFFREIRKSLPRFLSITAIVALGVAFFAGVRSSEPDMRLSADAYYDSVNYFDVRVISTLGLTEEDIDAIRACVGVSEAVGAYEAEAMCKYNSDEYTMTVYSVNDSVNKLDIAEGRLPESADECFVDIGFCDSTGCTIGDKITLNSGRSEDISETISNDTYTIVGYGTYASYLSWTRGTSTIGDGKADAFLFLPAEVFVSEYYYEIYVTVDAADSLNCYEDEYADYIAEITAEIEAIAGERCEVRYSSIMDEGNAKISDAEAELADAKASIADGEKAIEDAKEKIADAEKAVADGEAEIATNEESLNDVYGEIAAAKEQLALNESYLTASGADDAAWAAFEYQKAAVEAAEQEADNGKKELEEAKQKIAETKLEIEDANAEISEHETEIEDAKKKVSDAEADIATGKDELAKVEYPEWYVLDRNSIQTFVEYGLDAERIGAIGKLFPVIFFLVAALVSLTTMTRMVEEERSLIGTMMALGYDKWSIASKYFLYALCASLIGGAAGILIGSSLLPGVIISAYGILYTTITVILTPINWGISIAAVAAATFCTLAATLFSCYREFMSQPAILMRPPVPKKGKRVLLEHIGFIWRRMSFISKSTVRNLFRYKKRFFMTVIGIGGCMGLLLVGYGLRDSIKEIVNNQYTMLWTYDVYLSVDGIEKSSTQVAEEHDEILSALYVHQTTMEVTANGTTKDAIIFAPERLDDLDSFVVLRDRVTDEHYEITDDGVVISEKLASLLELEVGDMITFKVSETENYDAPVTAIVENYIYHYVYMTPAGYEKIFGKTPEFNQLYLKAKDLGTDEMDALGEVLLQEEGVKSITFVSELEKTVQNMMTSLDFVVWVLIGSAGLLAFIVLYNLNNINIVERRRELATLKVLGFYDSEIAQYVYRENIVLTVFGIIFGIAVGIVLHQFVIKTCEIDMIMFGRQIKSTSYVMSIIMTLIFSALVNYVMYFKLKKIDMVESLKSVE